MVTTAPPRRARAKTAPAKPLPKSRQPKLSKVARHVLFPSAGVRSLFADVLHVWTALGIPTDVWQDGIAQISLLQDDEGRYVCRVGGVTISIPRQAGKTYTIGWLIFALCLLTPGLRVVWTAHHETTAAETFDNFDEMAATRTVKPHILKVYRDDKKRSIRFRNGSVIMFGAREHGFGRGKAGIDIVVFDEAQILSEAALENLQATTNTSSVGLVFFIGTPPRPIDRSEVFRRKRTQALRPDPSAPLRGAYIEFSADEDADSRDEEQVKKANPSYMLGRVQPEAIEAGRANLSEESFRREYMGIWDNDTILDAVDLATWDRGTIQSVEAPTGKPLAWSVDITPTRIISISSVIPYPSPDERLHVELVKSGPLLDSFEDIADWLAARTKSSKTPVAVSMFGPGAALASLLTARGVKVMEVNGNDAAKACATFEDKVMSKSLTHLSQAPMDIALASARKRDYGTQGGWVWALDKTPVPMSPLMSGTLAVFAATQEALRPKRGVW